MNNIHLVLFNSNFNRKSSDLPQGTALNLQRTGSFKCMGKSARNKPKKSEEMLVPRSATELEMSSLHRAFTDIRFTNTGSAIIESVCGSAKTRGTAGRSVGVGDSII